MLRRLQQQVPTSLVLAATASTETRRPSGGDPQHVAVLLGEAPVRGRFWWALRTSGTVRRVSLALLVLPVHATSHTPLYTVVLIYIRSEAPRKASTTTTLLPRRSRSRRQHIWTLVFSSTVNCGVNFIDAAVNYYNTSTAVWTDAVQETPCKSCVCRSFASAFRWHDLVQRC